MDWKKIFSPIERLKSGLKKTRDTLTGGIKSILTMHRKIDDELIDELEEALVLADIGVETANHIITDLRQAHRDGRLEEASEVLDFLKRDLKEQLTEKPNVLQLADQPPTIILIVGVNGTGKTTSIAKLAGYLINDGKKVLLAACDTFRAAADEQLDVWSKRLSVDIVKGHTGADPAAVVFDAIDAAIARKADVLLVDTAGRLHTKQNLMAELEKINRVIKKKLPNAPQEVLLVLDATTGQNAIAQAQTFGEAVGVTGIFLTKLDGTAKGGIVIAILKQLNIPVKFVGFGETPEDIETFDADRFVEALFS